MEERQSLLPLNLLAIGADAHIEAFQHSTPVRFKAAADEVCRRPLIGRLQES